MKPASRLDCGRLCLRFALVYFYAAFVSGCQTDTVVLSPSMHARVVDGATKKPLDQVRVTLVSWDATATATAYSNKSGFVDMPGLVGSGNVVFRIDTDSPHAAVHALFERPGYQPYIIDSVNGYGFFKGYTDVRLYPE